MEHISGILNRLAAKHRIAELKKARKMYWCDSCGLPIIQGEHYYCVTWAGAGLGSIKFPDRVHVECLEKFLEG